MKLTKKLIVTIVATFLIIISFTFYDVIIKSDFVETITVTSNITPQPAPTPEPTIKPAETIKFIGVGDNLIHGMLYMQANNRANGNGYDFDYAYENIEHYFDDFDIKFIVFLY